MDKTLTVIKIGGNVVDKPDALASFVADFAKMPGPKILVHGGGKEATRMSQRMGIETQMIDGRRVTDQATLEIVTMVYAGLVNKRIVSMLQACGCNAIGLTGADACSITATRRPPQPINYGYVGDLTAESIDSQSIMRLIDSGFTPVFCAITHDGKGTLLNCNADSVASAVAIGMSRTMATDLVFCFEKNGVMRDVDDPNSVIGTITAADFDTLVADGTISKGMIPKVQGAVKAVNQGVRHVIIRNSEKLGVPSGTVVQS